MLRGPKIRRGVDHVELPKGLALDGLEPAHGFPMEKALGISASEGPDHIAKPILLSGKFKAVKSGLLALRSFAGAGVLEGDQAFGEGLIFEEGEFALRESAGEEQTAFADQDWNDAHIELVDNVVLEEVASEFSAAHQPDIFSRLLPEFLDETSGGFIDERDAAALAGRLGMGEHVALSLRVAETATHFESIVVGFATHDHRVDGGEERAHGIVLGHEEKIDRAIGAGDVAVEADAEAEDHLAHGRHSKRREVNSSTGVIS